MQRDYLLLSSAMSSASYIWLIDDTTSATQRTAQNLAMIGLDCVTGSEGNDVSLGGGKLIDNHIADFEFVSHKASREAIKAAPGERIEATRTRLTERAATQTRRHPPIELVKLRGQDRGQGGSDR